MSIERELLKECRLILDTPFNGSTGINLRNRIAELLAQPEQPEPVYWENEKKALLNEIDHLTNQLAQPELSTDSLQLDEQEPVAWLYTERQFGLDWWVSRVSIDKPKEAEYRIDITPLYTSPQKREPLSKEAIRAIVNQLPTEVDLDTGIEFCKIIEKAHGIGGKDEAHS